MDNWGALSSEYRVGAGARGLLEQNGFAVVRGDGARADNMATYYDILKERGLPIVVTSDSVLHLHHLAFSDSLKRLEAEHFYDDVWRLSRAMMEASVEQRRGLEEPELREAALRNAAFFAVGLELLEPRPGQACESGCPDGEFTPQDYAEYSSDPPAEAAELARAELALVRKEPPAKALSPIFGDEIDYTSFKPRGHYTDSERLSNYFMAVTWYGEASFRIYHTSEAEYTDEDGFNRMHVAQAVLLSDALLSDGGALERWDRVYDATSFYVGRSDDLGPREYARAHAGLGAGGHGALLDGAALQGLAERLAAESPSRIMDGAPHQKCQLPADPATGFRLPWTPELTRECLAESAGMRFMGQRFVPDSYVFTELTGFGYAGSERPFTVVPILDSPYAIRGFPRGLDLMSVMGSERAAQIIEDEGDADYEHYAEQAASLRAELESYGEGHWTQNLYWSWLHALRPLLDAAPAHYPAFMRTDAWEDKGLHTALASWSQLRHDTILYAKQSETASATSYNPPADGYVEPAPELYKRLRAAAEQARGGLAGFGLLDDEAIPDCSGAGGSLGGIGDRLYCMAEMLRTLERISEAQIRGERLGAEDYEYISHVGHFMDLISPPPEESATTLIADVHSVEGLVLEEGTGYIDTMLVVYDLPDGRTLIGMGPALSYYEFKQPREDRLTDEQWKVLLDEDAPGRPGWAGSFQAGLPEVT